MPKKKKSRRRYFRHKGVKHDRRFPLAYAPAIIVPAAKILFGNGLSPGIVPAFQSGDMGQISNAITMTLPFETIGYASWDGTWNFNIIGRNLGLILGGMAVDKLATMTGLNKQMRKIPMLGRYLKV
jgi:hypothetical protein